MMNEFGPLIPSPVPFGRRKGMLLGFIGHALIWSFAVLIGLSGVVFTLISSVKASEREVPGEDMAGSSAEFQADLRPAFPWKLVVPRIVERIPGKLVEGPVMSGTRLACLVEIAGNTEVYFYDVDRGQGRYLNVGRGRKSDLWISGNLLAWTDYREGRPTVYLYNLYGDAEQRVTSQRGYEFRPRLWGNLLVWYRTSRPWSRDDNPSKEMVPAELLSTEIGATKGIRIISSDCDPSVPPIVFGSDLFYRSVSADSPGVTWINMASGERVPLGFDGTPAWCDGERLLVLGVPESGYRQLYEVRFKKLHETTGGRAPTKLADLYEPPFRRVSAFPSNFEVSSSDGLTQGYKGLVAICGSTTGPDGKRLPGVGYLLSVDTGGRSLLEVKVRVPADAGSGDQSGRDSKGQVVEGPPGQSGGPQDVPDEGRPTPPQVGPLSEFHSEISSVTVSGYYLAWSSISPVGDVSPVRRTHGSTLIWVATLSMTYSDIQDHWAKKTIERFPQAIMGYEDGTFHPDGPVSRAELVSLFGWKSSHLEEGNPLMVRRWEFARALGIALASRGVLPPQLREFMPFEDEDDIPAGVRQLVHSLSRDWFKGYPDGSFRPNRFVTRAEALTLFERWNDYLASTARRVFPEAHAKAAS